jgi:DNA-binding MarR family transcriptional regulator
MWMIVLPYLGPAAAAKELRRAEPGTAAPTRVEPMRDALDGLQMRMTHRTAGVLAAVAERGGRNNVEISELVGIHDQGQMSKLLARLAGLGLLENTGGGHARGEANAWRLTARGRHVERALSREFGGRSGHFVRSQVGSARGLP